MGRFAKNQWWAFILTLSVLLASSASFTSSSYAASWKDLMYVSDGGSGGLSGDPDGPGGPNSSSPNGPGKYRLAPGGNTDAVRPVGDGSAAMRVWSWRFHIVLRSLVGRWSR
jgi:hypothetical protein